MHLAEFLVCLLVVGGSSAAPVISHDVIRDFARVIPMEKVWDVVSDYIVYDKDIKNLLEYIQTAEFKHMIAEIDAMPEFIEFLSGLEESGYAAYKYWNIIHSLLGMAGLQNPNEAAPPHLTGGVLGLVQDVKALVKEDEIVKVYEEMLKNNPKLKTLVDHFQGEGFKKVLEKLVVLPQVATILEKMGISELVPTN